ERAEWRRGLADALEGAGVVAVTRGDLRAARAAHERALKIRTELAGPTATEDAEAAVASTLYQLAHLQLAQGDPARARAAARRSQKRRAGLLAAAPGSFARRRELALSLLQEADLLLQDADCLIVRSGLLKMDRKILSERARLWNAAHSLQGRALEIFRNLA